MKYLKIMAVVVGAVVITALGIDAADTLQGNRGTLFSQVINGEGAGCGEGMVAIETVPGISCVDVYEVSAGDKCPITHPGNAFDSQANVNADQCRGVSRDESNPWRFVTREQAVQICAMSGKRLPSASEWYGLATGLSQSEEKCNVSSGALADAGEYLDCKTNTGVFDLVGNVWEWVSDDVIDGSFNARALPDTGFVEQVDSAGVVTVTSLESNNELFGDDYAWSKKEGSYGIIRGGFYNSGSDAGIYTVHADTLPTTAGLAIGFRCVR